MKYILIFTALYSILFQPQEEKIVGKYKMEYEQEFKSQNGTIDFDGTIFKRKRLDGKKTKGIIDYQKNFVYLNDKSNLQVIFAKREIKQDTIYFRTKDLNNKSPESELTIFSGKLIKIK